MKDADGKIRIWHYTSGKLISTIEEQGNEINDLSYRPDGLQFSTGGSDAVLRIYDSVTLNSIHTLSAGGDNQTQGHSSRVFCSKFHPTQKHLLVSGGWDNTLLIWDLRSGKAVRSIFGPHICGDSIDLNDAGTTLLTGSYSKKNPLQLWDWESGKLLSNVSWAGLDSDSAHTSLLYSASFSRGKESPVGPCNNRFMIAAGSNSNEIRVYTADAQRGVVGSVVGLPDAIYSVAMSPSDRYIAAGGGSQALLVFNVEERSTN